MLFLSLKYCQNQEEVSDGNRNTVYYSGLITRTVTRTYIQKHFCHFTYFINNNTENRKALYV